MTCRLLALAVLPVLVLAVVSLPFAQRMQRDVSDARVALGGVRSVAGDIAFMDAVVSESSYAQAQELIAASGITVADAGRVGVHPGGDLVAAEAGTDKALAAVARPLRRQVRDVLESARHLVSSPEATVSGVRSAYGLVRRVVQQRTRQDLASSEAAVLATAGATTAEQSFLVLRTCDQILEAAARELADMAGVWSATSPTQWKLSALRLVKDQALFSRAGTELARSGIEQVEQAWAAFERSSSTAVFDAVMQAAEMHGPSAPGPGQQKAAAPVSLQSLQSAYDSIRNNRRLIADSTDQAGTIFHTQMSSLVGSEGRAYALWLLVMVLAALIVLAVAFLVARTISGPLRSLAHAADAVVAGQIDVAPLEPSGPRETALVTDAFNSLIGNLRLLEAKTRALAECDFANDVLAVPLPGPLGASLHESVHVLAESIQDRHALEQRLAHEASHDLLTGLLNRTAAIDALEQSLALGRRHSWTTAVFYVDLDGFKRANDLHGHHCGDHMLRAMGRRLTALTRTGDSVGRLGGDEFVVIAPLLEGPEEAEAIGRRLLDAMAQPFQWNGIGLTLGACVGITVSRGAATRASDLLAQADLALLEAKHNGDGSVAVFDEGMQRELARREAIEDELRRELVAGGPNLRLYYQPIVDAGVQVHGFEALLRWDLPGRGLLAPCDFVPVAEASDLIVQLDKWVLARTARQISEWSSLPGLAHPVRVSANVSGRHLSGGQLTTNLAEVLQDSRIDPACLTIEITETVLLDDLEAAAGELEAVRSLGVAVAVDDFGTGYTSLAHLHHLPVDYIKIDRTFVSDVERPSDSSLVRMITDLARHLGLTTVSEGVETAEQFDMLRRLGSDCMQGYLIARTMPAEDVPLWVPPESPPQPGRPCGAESHALI